MRKSIGLLAAVLAMLLSCTVSAQKIDSMMGVYADKLPVEKIHIHFDKTVYNRGETVWYKVYMVQSGVTEIKSKNVYLEWYDSEGKMIKQSAAPLFESTAKGSFDIPADYKGESLHVKAFTRWMLNDDPAFGYERALKVNITGAVTLARAPIPKTRVEIFPEGGFLVQGLPARIAFKASNSFGDPVHIKTALVDGKTTVLDSLKIQHDGMGSFTLTPSAGQSYQLNWIDENGIQGTTLIPVTKTQGASMRITTTKETATFQIERTAAAPDIFKQMTLLVHMNQNTLYRIAINTTDKTTARPEIPIHELPTGLLQFTLFGSDGIPVAERIVFVNNADHHFTAEVMAPVIGLDKRGKNVLDIHVPDTLLTNMSLSVTDAALYPPDQHTIYSDLFLSSEIKGKIYNPGYYFENEDETVASHLDLVMLTNGWRRFDWDKIKASIPPKISYAAETEFMKMQGKITGVKTEQAVMNMIVVAKDSSKQVVLVPVEKDGSFKYDMFFYDTAKIYYGFNDNVALRETVRMQMDNGLIKPGNKKIEVSGNRPFLWNDSDAKMKLTNLLVEQETLAKKMADATLKEVTVYTRPKSKEELLSEKYAGGFFSKNNAYIFDLTDDRLIVSQDIFEYLQNKIPGLKILEVTLPNGGILILVQWRWDEPDYFVNEMRIQKENKEAIRAIPISDIAMVKVYPPIFMFSTGGGRGGAIAIWTKKGNDARRIDTDVKRMDHTSLGGYTNFKEFYSPSYEKPDERHAAPDKRTTLYWNPDVMTDAGNKIVQVQFYNNDFTKKFQVVLEGINSAGKVTRFVRTIDSNTKVD